MLLEIRNGTVSQNGQTVLSHFNFAIKGTEKIAVVGRNGAGKSTLLRVIAGEKALDADEKNPGSGLFCSRRFTVGMLPQQVVTEPEMSVEECILGEFKSRTHVGRGSRIAYSGNETDGSGGNVFSRYAGDNVHVKSAGANAGEPEIYSRERYEFEQHYDRFLTEMGFSLSDKSKQLKAFSGGEQTKIMLIRLLLQEPDVLILDEPTNHLDLESVTWLEDYLKKYPKAVVCVSHDRYFIDQIADVVWEVNWGKTIRYPGNYSSYRREKEIRYEKDRKAFEAQQEEVERLNQLIKKFRGKPRKAAFARSRKKILDRMKMMECPDPEDAMIHVGDIQPEHVGDKIVFSCQDVAIGYREKGHRDMPESYDGYEGHHIVSETGDGSETVDVGDKGNVIRVFSFQMRRGQKVGIFGPNGTGKSTFLKTIAGQIPPLSGKLQVGEHIDLAYFDQLAVNRLAGEAVVFPEKEMSDAGVEEDTVGDHSTKAAGTGVNRKWGNRKSRNVLAWFGRQFPDMNTGDVRKYLAQFLFRGDDMGKDISVLSGGEKSRLILAAILARKPNFLVLDEPTNNMDIPAIEALETILKNYHGTVLVISHDRYFLNQVADGLLIFEPGTHELQYYPSDLDHYLEHRKRVRSGKDVSILRLAENQKLIDSLRTVPEKERGLLRQIPLGEQQLDWAMERKEEELQIAEKKFVDLCNEMEQLQEKMTESFDARHDGDMGKETIIQNWEVKYREIRDKMETVRNEWTKSCVDWYDVWQERESAGGGAAL